MAYKKIDDLGTERLSLTDFDVGDIVEQRPGSGAETLSRREKYQVTGIEYVYTSETDYQNGAYATVYKQRLKVVKTTNEDSWRRPNDNGYLAANFKLLEKRKNPKVTTAIENQKPAIAVEIDTNAAGEDVVKEGAQYMEFESGLKAKAAVSKIISDSIRERNEYRRFRVFSNPVVAGAKEPEIEFK